MFFSCLLVFTLAVAAIRRYFLARRHMKSEFQGPRRKGDGPVIRSAKEIARNAAADDAVALSEVFAASTSAQSVKAAHNEPVIQIGDERSRESDHDHVEALRLLPPLRVLTDEEIIRLASQVRLVAVPCGETLFAAGDAATTAYVIKCGNVSLLHDNDGGSDSSSRSLSSGDFFGEQALEVSETYGCTAISTSACQLWILEREKLSITLTSAQELVKRSSFQNVSLKTAATAALLATSLRREAPGAQPVQLRGVADSAPSLIPQQQAPLSLMASYSIPLPSSSSLPAFADHAASSQQAECAGASAAAGGASRVPRSLLKKHAMLFDSDTSAV